VKSYKML